MRVIRLGIIAFAYLLLASSGSNANAGFVSNLEFNVDGVLPSTNPGIPFFNNTGSPESTLYSVSGGLLQQRTFAVNGNASYIFPNLTSTGGPFTPTEDLVLESRIRVSQISGLGAYFEAYDGAYQLSVLLTSSGVLLPTLSGDVVIPVDVSTFHTYRLESSANTRHIDFFIDGNLVYNGFAQPFSGLNGFGFGDGITAAGNGANADYDFIRVSSQAPNVSAVPVPSTALLLCIGVAGLFAYKRRVSMFA